MESKKVAMSPCITDRRGWDEEQDILHSPLQSSICPALYFLTNGYLMDLTLAYLQALQLHTLKQFNNTNSFSVDRQHLPASDLDSLEPVLWVSVREISRGPDQRKKPEE